MLFLTEDDPKKVVTASMGKLSSYFRELDNSLNNLSHTMAKYIMEIDEFHDFKKNEKQLLNEMKDHKQNMKKYNSNIGELRETLKRTELRNEIQKKIELISNAEKITSDYENLKKSYEQLKNKKDTDIFRKIFREKEKLYQVDTDLKNNKARVIQSCNTLTQYGVVLSSEKLLNEDYSEYNKLVVRRQVDRQSEVGKTIIVDEMIELLQRHSEKDMVPVVNKSVGDVLRELYKIKTQQAFDRVSSLLSTLKSQLDERRGVITEQEKIIDKIRILSRNSKEIKNFETIEKAYLEAQEAFLHLQNTQQEDKNKLTSLWKQLQFVKGTPNELKTQLEALEVQEKTEENMTLKCEERLQNLRENSKEKPKFMYEAKKLQTLSEQLTRMRENLAHWILILSQPTEAREIFQSMSTKTWFKLEDYHKFVKAVGEFLGNQFEPITFANTLHEVKFYDIENFTFITKEDRHIPIDNLSQGQSKITTLTGSFKDLGEEKKKIVLVDEIADLDPENLQRVKDTLKEKLVDNKLALAVLVRPSHDPTSKPINISGWG